MESVQTLKKRLKSVKNINQVTKTMELVSSLKMRKAQEIAIGSRPYALAALDLLAHASTLKTELPQLLTSRPQIKNVLFVVVASDKGLAGAFNSALFKKLENHMERHQEKYQAEEKLFLSVGEKAAAYLNRRKLTTVGKFTEAGDFTTPDEVKPVSDFIVQGYLDGKWDRVVIVSTHFRSAMRQEALVRRILPVDFDHVKDIIKEIIPETGKFSDLIKEHELDFLGKNGHMEYLVEPSPGQVLRRLAEHVFFMQLYHLILEANAAEHSARRMAMKTASDNAKDLADDLNLQYNKSRQAQITKEIIEITAGAESFN